MPSTVSLEVDSVTYGPKKRSDYYYLSVTQDDTRRHDMTQSSLFTFSGSTLPRFRPAEIDIDQTKSHR